MFVIPLILFDYRVAGYRQGSLTVEVVPGTAVALSQTMRQAPFQIAHLFVNSSPDGNSLLLESDGSTNAHAVAADCFLQGSTPPALLVICGANAKVFSSVALTIAACIHLYLPIRLGGCPSPCWSCRWQVCGWRRVPTRQLRRERCFSCHSSCTLRTSPSSPHLRDVLSRLCSLVLSTKSYSGARLFPSRIPQ